MWPFLARIVDGPDFSDSSVPQNEAAYLKLCPILGDDLHESRFPDNANPKQLPRTCVTKGMQ
jgi:hypothetical protein